MCLTKVVEGIKTHILCSVTFFRKSCRSWDNVEKYCRAGQATDDNMAHAHCMLDTWGYNHTLSGYAIRLACPLQQRLHDRTSMLRCTYIACPVRLLWKVCDVSSDEGGIEGAGEENSTERQTEWLVVSTNSCVSKRHSVSVQYPIMHVTLQNVCLGSARYHNVYYIMVLTS
jgi:hypothetical protein